MYSDALREDEAPHTSSRLSSQRAINYSTRIVMVINYMMNHQMICMLLNYFSVFKYRLLWTYHSSADLAYHFKIIVLSRIRLLYIETLSCQRTACVCVCMYLCFDFPFHLTHPI